MNGWEDLRDLKLSPQRRELLEIRIQNEIANIPSYSPWEFVIWFAVAINAAFIVLSFAMEFVK